MTNQFCRYTSVISLETNWLICMMMMMMMMLMNCFCGMVDRRKAFYPYYQPYFQLPPYFWDYCQRSSPSPISDTPRAGFEPAQNLSSGLVEWSCAVVITTLYSFSLLYYQDNIFNDRIVWLIITLLFKIILFVKYCSSLTMPLGKDKPLLILWK